MKDILYQLGLALALTLIIIVAAKSVRYVKYENAMPIYRTTHK